ncbi:MAG: GTPase ObgE [Leptospiraceae bacterium]|nr:GTPase ObgE [Leptospiraceae bacterium]MCP5511246.1 GTPase ObgE [Leptospiraceae bacterium]
MSKFIDEVKIVVKAGHGGPGSVSFRHEKYAEFGGPDGGDGGKGGDVHILSDGALQTLDKYIPLKHYKAGAGSHGEGRNKFGKNGADLILKVPVGTEIIDLESGEMIYEFLEEGVSFTIARGGRGGKGNSFFKSSTHQAPRFAQDGEEGEEKEIQLNLKLLADLGIVGLPNSGKSTLLSKITDAHPKIAGYAFTTLVPNLGVVRRRNDTFHYTIADIPGIIEGASRGHGLGLSFLRHIERVRGILYMFDATSIDVAGELKLLKKELRSYNKSLPSKKSLIILNKMDLIDDENYLEDLKASIPGKIPIVTISAMEEKNIELLLQKIDRTFFKI